MAHNAQQGNLTGAKVRAFVCGSTPLCAANINRGVCLTKLEVMKIKVFFESDTHTKEVAVFNDEKIYLDCLLNLERRALKQGYNKVTEKVINEECTSTK